MKKLTEHDRAELSKFREFLMALNDAKAQPEPVTFQSVYESVYGPETKTP